MSCVSPLSFHIEILLYQHGRSALDTSRTLFLLASTQGVSCRPAMLMWKEYCLEHGKGSELLDDQQWASRGDAKKNIFFLMLNAGHPGGLCRTRHPWQCKDKFQQVLMNKFLWVIIGVPFQGQLVWPHLIYTLFNNPSLWSQQCHLHIYINIVWTVVQRPGCR